MKEYKLDGRLILPKTIDNAFKGMAPAKYILFIIAVFTAARSLIHVFLPDGGAQSIATIPLGSFPQNAADTVIYLFSVWGMSQLIMWLLYILVCFRYRSLIPLMYIFVTFEYAMRIVIGHMKPVITSGTAPGEIGNYVLIPVAIIMFFLSIARENAADTV